MISPSGTLVSYSPQLFRSACELSEGVVLLEGLGLSYPSPEIDPITLKIRQLSREKNRS
eukprot:gene454-237_t